MVNILLVSKTSGRWLRYVSWTLFEYMCRRCCLNILVGNNCYPNTFWRHEMSRHVLKTSSKRLRDQQIFAGTIINNFNSDKTSSNQDNHCKRSFEIWTHEQIQKVADDIFHFSYYYSIAMQHLWEPFIKIKKLIKIIIFCLSTILYLQVIFLSP